MATTDTASEALQLSEITIVDVDSHIGADFDDIIPYMENRAVRDIYERVPKEELGWKVFTSSRATPEFPNNRGAGDYDETLEHTHASEAETKLEFMRRYDIDYSVLTPGRLGLASVNHDQAAVEYARAHNDWMADAFFDRDDSLRSTIIIAHQVPHKAAEEIDRWADEDDVVGVALPSSGLVPPAGHHWHDPIYEAATDNDLPVVMHTGNATATASFPVQRKWAKNFTEDHFFTFPVEGMWHMASIMFRGTLERHPGLQFVMEETGVEWLPWMEWRMDDHYLQSSRDVPELTRMPSEYIHDHFTFDTQPLGHTDNKKHLAQLLDIAGGEDMIMFATDHPHPDFDPPEELFATINQHFDADAVRGMMGETAMDVFGL